MPKKQSSQKKTKRTPASLRLTAILLAVLLTFSSALVQAQSVENSGIGDNIVSSENKGTDEPIVSKITIQAENKTLTVGEEIYLLEGVTATDEEGNDYSDYLSVVQSADFNEEVGTYLATYYVIVEDKTLASKDIKVIIQAEENQEETEENVSDYKIQANDITIKKEQYTTVDEIDFLKDVLASDKDGKDVSENLTVDTSELNLDEINDYTITYTLTISDEIVAEKQVKVSIVENGIKFFAPNMSLYTRFLKNDQSFKARILHGITAIGLDGEDLSQYVEVIDDGGGNDFTTRGIYTLTYALIKDGETLATMTRVIKVDPIKLSLFGTYASNTLGGDATNGDKLSVTLNSDGSTSIFRNEEDEASEEGSWIPQYYGFQYDDDTNEVMPSSDSNGVILKIGSIAYSLSANFGLNEEQVLINVEPIEEDAKGNQSILRTYKVNLDIETVPDMNERYIIVTEKISLDKGSDTISREWNIKNEAENFSAEGSQSSARLVYGGDTFFSGHDNGWTNYRNIAGKTVFVYRAEDHGTMSLQGDISTPAADYFAGKYYVGEELAMLGDLSSSEIIGQAESNIDSEYIPSFYNSEDPESSFYKNFYMVENPRDVDTNPEDHYVYKKVSGPNPKAPELPREEIWETSDNLSTWEVNQYQYIDTSYYLQWNKNGNFNKGDEWNVKSYEIFSAKGDIQLTPQGAREAPPGTKVSHNFTIENRSIVDNKIFKVKFEAISGNASTGNPWRVQAPDPILRLEPGESRTITVHTWTPDDAENDDFDILSLKAIYEQIVDDNETGEVTAVSSTKTVVNNRLAIINDVTVTRLVQAANEMDVRITYANVPEELRPVELRLTIQDENFEKIEHLEPVLATLRPGEKFVDVPITGLEEGKKYWLYVEAVDRNVIPYPHNTTSFVLRDIIQPESMQLLPEEVTINKGSTYDKFEVIFTPDNVTENERRVTWESSDPFIASIDRTTGEVTAHKVGTVTITARSVTDPDNIFDTSTLHVKHFVDEVVVEPSGEKIIKKGDSFPARLSITPAEAAQNADWSSLDSAIASVAAGADTRDSIITGTGDGITTITGASTDDPTKQANITVKVDGTKPEFTSFNLVQQSNGQKWDMSYISTDPVVNGFASDVDKVYYQVSTTAPTFNPADTSAWTVLNGPNANVELDPRAWTNGDYKVYAVVKDKVGNYTEVLSPSDNIVITPVSGITLTPDLAIVGVNQTFTGFVATITPANASNQTVIWSSDNEAIATVDANGVVTGKAPGTITITATSQANPALTATATVIVKNVVSGISVDPTEKTIKAGTDFTAIATIHPAEATYRDVDWSSDAGTVASVNNVGKIIGLSDGVAIITVASHDDPTKTALVKVSVDGTAPVMDTFTVGKQTGVAKWNLNLKASDPVVNGFASGVDKIYYQISTTTPTFNPVDTSAWKVVNGEQGLIEIDAALLAEGIYKVYVMPIDKVGNYNAAGNILESDEEIVVVKTISVSPADEQIIKKGNTFTATVNIQPASAAVLWESADTSIASVVAGTNHTAVVTGVGDGVTKIKVSSVDDPSKFTEITVNVDGTNPTILSINPTLQTNGQTWTVDYTSTDPVVNGFASGVKEVYYQVSATNPPAFNLANTTGWTKIESENGSFEVDMSQLNGGDYNIYMVTVDKVGNYETASIASNTIITPASGITLTPDLAIVGVNQTFTGFVATITPANASNQTVIWSSSNEAIATVDANGVVTGKAPGTITITATSQSNPNLTATATVIVKNVVSGISVDPTEKVMKAGTDFTAIATIHPAEATYQDVDWSSDAGVVASVDNTAVSSEGKITGLTDGIANITAASHDDPTQTANVKVSVDGTNPIFTTFNVIKQTNAQKWDVKLITEDTIRNGFASGVDKIYYQVSATSPTGFDPSNPSAGGWIASTGDELITTIDAATLENGVYRLYSVVVDKVGNYDATGFKTSNEEIIVVKDVSVSPSDEQIIRKGDTFTATVNIQPASAAVLWESADTTIASVVAGANHTAVVTGTGDGITKIKVSSIDDPSKFAEITVKVDGTAPVVSEVKLTEETASWRGLINTNRAIKATTKTVDPVVNGFASDVKNTYVSMIKVGTAAPAFSETSADWHLVTKNAQDVSIGTFVFNHANTIDGSDTEYKVYAISLDNVGNIGEQVNSEDNVNIITDDPEIKFPGDDNLGVNGRDLHVLEGTNKTTIDYRANVQVNGSLVGNDSNLVINDSQVNTAVVGVYNVTYTYTDAAGNVGDAVRKLYVHGKPSVVAAPNTLNTTVEETPNINVLNNSRFTLSGSASYYGHTGTTVVPKTVTALAYEVGSADLEGTPVTVAANGTLDLSALTVASGTHKTYTIKITSSYVNEVLGQTITSADTATITIKVYADGENPDGLTPIPVTPGIVIPGKPGVPPTDPQFENHINFYQNHGTIKSDGNKQNGDLTVTDIQNAVSIGNANGVTYTTTITVDGTVLDATNLATALGTTGTKIIEYKFVTASGAITRYKVALRVNSDFTSTSVAALDVNQGTSISTAKPAGLTGTYIDYTNTEITPSITAPASIPTNTIGAFNAEYKSAYPYEAKTINAIVRVHGKISFGVVNPIHVRVGDTNITSDLLATATVQIAPATVGGAVRTENITDIALTGSNGNCHAINKFTQQYKATYNLPAEYANASFELTNNVGRLVHINGKPEISANNVVISKGMTAAQFNLFTQANVTANVQYCDKPVTDLKNKVVQSGDAIQFGTPGVYTIKLNVSDTGVTACPTTLPPIGADEKVFTVEVRDGNVGDGPSLTGSVNIKALEGQNITDAMIRQGIVAKRPSPNSTQNAELSYTISKVGGGATELSNVTTAFGQYEITYTAYDPISGNSTSGQLGVINVYTPITLNVLGEQKFREGDTFILDDTNVTASYTEPNGTLVTMNKTTHPSNFTTTGITNTSTIGVFTPTIKVVHPEFSANNASGTLTVKVYGKIKFEKTEDTSFRVGEDEITNIVSRLEVKAYYMDIDKVTRVDIPVTSNPVALFSIDSVVPNKFGVDDINITNGRDGEEITYTAVDHTVRTNETVTATNVIRIKPNSPSLNIGVVGLQFKRGKIGTYPALLSALKPTVTKPKDDGTMEDITSQYQTPTAIYAVAQPGISHFVMQPRPNINKVGNYTSMIYAVDSDGNFSEGVKVTVSVM